MIYEFRVWSLNRLDRRISAVFQGRDLLSFGEELSRELSRARASYYSSDRAIRDAVDIDLRCPCSENDRSTSCVPIRNTPRGIAKNSTRALRYRWIPRWPEGWEWWKIFRFAVDVTQNRVDECLQIHDTMRGDDVTRYNDFLLYRFSYLKSVFYIFAFFFTVDSKKSRNVRSLMIIVN